MPLSFLVPALLAGLAALAVPVVLHLSRRRTARQVEFPSLMFVRRMAHPETRRRRIRDPLLLALRCLALALIVAAFARPFLDRRAPVALDQSGGREMVVLLDRSYSMGYGERWQRAVAEVERAIEGMQRGDRATLVLFDDGAEAAVRSTGDAALLRSALRDARPGSGGTRVAPGLRLAESILSASASPRRQLVVVSDFQSAAWEGPEGTGSVRLPEGTEVVPASVAEPTTENVAVTGVGFQRERVQGRERVTATARLVHRGQRPVRDLAVSLVVDGRVLEQRRVDLEPDAPATVSFAPFTLARADTRGAVRVESDALPADDEHRFVLSPGQALGVLVVDAPGASAGASLFLRRALDIGGDPGFATEQRRGAALGPADLAGRAVVVLNDAPVHDAEAGRRLREWVERGGGLIALAGPVTEREGWGRGAAPLLDALDPRAATRRDEAGAALGYVDYGHPVFAPFRAPGSGDVSAARFYSYRPLQATGDSRVLARYGDGSAALAERTLGAGRVIAWGSTLDAFWNDLALQPVFLPLVHRLVTHAAGYAPPRPALTVGEVLQTGPTGGAAPSLLRTPAGESLPLDPDAPARVAEAGYYELRSGAGGEALAALLAVNPDPAESDLQAIDPERVVSLLAGRSEPAPGAAAAPDAPERERRQSLWWYLLVLAALLLAADTALGNRLPRAAR